MSDREIPDLHRAVLCTALSVQEVPPSVVARYWRVKRCADRTNVFLNDHDLALIAGWDESNQEATPPKPTVDWSQVPYGSEVTAYWRNKERIGVFQGVGPTGDLFVVLNGNNPDVREIAPHKVSLLDESLV